MSGRASTHPPIKTFFGCPACMNPNDLDARVAFLGVPYDGGTNPFTRSGSRTGPDSVRDQQTFQYAGDYFGPAPAMGVPSAGWYDIEEEKTYLEGVTMADAGDVAIAGGSTTIAFNTVTRVVEQLAATDAVVAAVGGDHSVAFPVGRGMGRYDEIDIVHIDAHADFSDEVNGSRFSHGSNLRRLSELPFVRNITVLGIRKATRGESRGTARSRCHGADHQRSTRRTSGRRDCSTNATFPQSVCIARHRCSRRGDCARNHCA